MTAKPFSMQKKNNIGIDLMGCETQPIEIANEIVDLIEELPSCYHITFFCSPNCLREIKHHPRINYQEAPDVILMTDDPLTAVRRKKNSSLCVAMQMLKNKEIDALISACNTGALIASANLFLPKLPSIERPALLTLMPTMKHAVAILDVGANPGAKAHHLAQYAAIGIAYQKSRDIEMPKVGLLNIGSEKSKGTLETREAYKLMQQFQSMFIGNIEGRDVFNGDTDVVVTEGFAGNVLLKTAEGIASFILHEIEKDPGISGDLAALRKRLHYAEYPGAIVAGVEGIVMKCHGDGSPTAFRESLKASIQLLSQDFLARIKKELSLVAF
jgi:glycerol-3-phosphate acyltransferase PlsX